VCLRAVFGDSEKDVPGDTTGGKAYPLPTVGRIHWYLAYTPTPTHAGELTRLRIPLYGAANAHLAYDPATANLLIMEY